jgi:hypothetical protein
VGLLAAILETAHHSDSSDLSMCTVGKECSFSKIKNNSRSIRYCFGNKNYWLYIENTSTSKCQSCMWCQFPVIPALRRLRQEITSLRT